MRKVLIISGHFPPLNTSGVYRPTKFVKFLPEFGWQPYVITCVPEKNDDLDEALMVDIPSQVAIFRIPIPHPQPVTKLARLVRWKPKSNAQPLDFVQDSSDAVNKIPFSIRLRRVLLSIPYLIQYPPIDDWIYWSIKILRVAYEIIQKEGIDVIMTTSPPWSPLLSGLLLKYITKKPWVVDMRDPWTTDNYRYKSTGLRLLIDKRVERYCISGADAVISVTPNWVEDLKKTSQNNCRNDHFFLITNGFDPDDFVSEKSNLKQKDNGIIRLYHPGSLYKGSLEPLIKGIIKFQQRGIPSKLRCEFVGYIHPEEVHQLESSSAHEIVQWEPRRISHTDALEEMKKAQILFLSLPFDYFPSKLFEYMNAGRPILALTNTGNASELIRHSGTGCVVSPDNPDRLADVLEQIATDYTGFVTQYYQPERDVIRRYERRFLTERLSTVLNTCAYPHST